MFREQIEYLLNLHQKAQEEKKETRKHESHTLFELMKGQQLMDLKTNNLFSKSEEKPKTFNSLNLDQAADNFSQIQRNNLVLVSFLQNALNMKADASLFMNPESLLLGGQK